VLLEEGIGRLRPFAPSCQGVDVGSLISEAIAAREVLVALGPDRMRDYDLGRAPKVRLAEAR
jgi:hypothetical protein